VWYKFLRTEALARDRTDGKKLSLKSFFPSINQYFPLIPYVANKKPLTSKGFLAQQTTTLHKLLIKNTKYIIHTWFTPGFEPGLASITIDISAYWLFGKDDFF
jgi:hypothetical protein